ncbi:Serine/threonine-protein kinase, partial [Kickxella alabastrina]
MAETAAGGNGNGDHNATSGERSGSRCRLNSSKPAETCDQAQDYRTASVFDGRVKIIDFGLANFFDGTSLMETFCGSLPYTAPEILRGDAYVGPEIDVWSLGVLLYVMLTGQFPFEDPAQAKNFDKIMAGDFSLKPSMSRELQDLLLRMLEPNAKRRITMKAILHHPWLQTDRVPVPGTCCAHHQFPIVDAIHDRRTLLLPGPAVSPLVAREVATCLDRSLDDVTHILEAAMASGRPQSNGQVAVSASASASAFAFAFASASAPGSGSGSATATGLAQVQ